MPNIFTIGQSALSAAQAGMTTAGQNIANASTVGYSRQTVVQTAATPQALGFGFIGQGTQVVDIQRNYNDYLGTQVLAASSASHQLDTQYTQASLIDNMLADPSAGVRQVARDVRVTFRCGNSAIVFVECGVIGVPLS